MLHLKNWQELQSLEEPSSNTSQLDVQNVMLSGLEGQPIYSQGMDVQSVFATEVPTKFHNHPRIIEAKKEEMKR